MQMPETDAQTETKHTKGPWTADRRGAQGVANYTVIGTPANFHTEIARVYHGDRFANGEANARLIAASPDLLEALRAAQSLIAVTLGEGADAIVPERVPTRLGVPVKAGAIMEQISAALSKAGA
jgi:hypothetical protein